MTEWQPIETAPKDKTEILVWSNGYEGPYLAIYIDNWWIADEFPYEWYKLQFPPTHWMPLPPSPNQP